VGRFRKRVAKDRQARRETQRLVERAQGPMFPAEGPVAAAKEADLALRLLVLRALLLARTRVETVAAELETPVDPARKGGRFLQEAVRKLAKQADGETRLLEFAAAVPREAAPLVQWLWKPA